MTDSAAHNCPTCQTDLEWRESFLRTTILRHSTGGWWCRHCRAFKTPKK